MTATFRRFVCAAGLFGSLLPAQTLHDRLKSVFGAADAERASTALASQNYSQLEQIFSSATLSSPANKAQLLAVRGAVEFLAGRWDQSASSFREAQVITTLSENDRFTYAMALVKLNQPANSQELLVSLAKDFPRRALYPFWLGRIDYEQRRYDAAIEQLTRALSLEPDSARIADALGLAFDMAGRQEEALAAFNKAVQQNRAANPQSPMPPHNFGYLLLRLNRPAEAETALRESLQIDSHLAEAHYHLGRALEAQTRIGDAIAEYQQAMKLDPQAADACYSLAKLLQRTNRSEEAERMFAEYRKRRSAPELSSNPRDFAR